MKRTGRKFHWNYTALAFAIPCTGMLFVMLISQYEPFGKYSMLYSDMYHQYWADDMLVIKKLITEAPKGTDEFWHTDLEKMLVDIVSDKLLRSCVNQGEYKTIFTQAFKDFYIDESQLFRYARRRNAKAKVLEQIDKSLLRTE